MKRGYLSLLLAFALALSFMPASGASGGSCGDNVYWSYSDGTLTVSGSGDMESAPWDEFIDDIKKAVIEKGVTGIADSAFFNSVITYISIGDSVTSIGNKAFYACKSLSAIKLPAGLRRIGYNAFAWCEALESITIPGSAGILDEDIFYCCENLKTVVLENGICEIPKGMFLSCEALRDVAIPDTITHIGELAFQGCEKLSDISVPDNVTAIGGYAFRGSGATKISIGKGVKDIGREALSRCPGLLSISVDEKNNYFSSQDGVLYNKSKTSLLCYPTGKTDAVYNIPVGVSTIGDYAFMNCKNIKKAYIPSGVKTIGECTFYGCENLSEAAIPDTVTLIGYSSFYNCQGITRVVFPQGVAKINYTTFSKCSNLSEAVIPGSVTEIEYNAFDDCPNLTIYGEEGSAAQAFALENNFTFKSSGSPKTAIFSDVPLSHWAAQYINALAAEGIISGYGDGTYGPDDTVTREQFIKLIVCALNCNTSIPGENGLIFQDVLPQRWSYPYITNGLLSGVIDMNDAGYNCFEPQNGIDRDTVALWMIRGLGIESDTLPEFHDSYLIDNQAAVATAADADLITGYEDGTFRPDNTLTRAEVAAVIFRVTKYFKEMNTLRPSPNIVELRDEVTVLDAGGSRNVLYEKNESDGYYVLSNIDDGVKNLKAGDKFVIHPCNNVPDGLAMKVKRIDINGTRATIWQDDITAGDFITQIDIAQEVPITLADIEEESLAAGVTATNELGQTIAEAKSLREENSNSFYADNEYLAALTTSGKLGFGLDVEPKKGLKIKGNISFDFPSLIADVKFDGLGLEKFEIKLKNSAAINVKVEKKGEGKDYYKKDEMDGKYKLFSARIPVGTTPFAIKTAFYIVIGVSGEISLEAQWEESSTRGFSYNGKSITKINKKENCFTCDITASGTFTVGPLWEIGGTFFEVIKLSSDIEGGLKFTAEVTKDITVSHTDDHVSNTQTDSVSSHSCLLCIAGRASLYVKMTPQVTLGWEDVPFLGDLTITPVRFSFETDFPFCQFYVSRKELDKDGVFGLGECPDLHKELSGADEPGSGDVGNEGNGLGNLYSGFAVTDGTNIFYSANNRLYKEDMEGNNRTVLAEGSFEGLVLYKDWIFGYKSGFLTNGTLKKIKKDGSGEAVLGYGLYSVLQIEDGYLYYYRTEAYSGEDGTICRIPVTASSEENREELAEGFDPVIYNGWIYYIDPGDDESYYLTKITADGNNKTVVLPYHVQDVNILDGKIYFTYGYSIYSMNTDGSGLTKLLEEDNRIESLSIYDNHIYYVYYDNRWGKNDPVCRVDLNGQNKEIIVEDLEYDMCIAGGWFYGRSADSYSKVRRARAYEKADEIE